MFDAATLREEMAAIERRVKDGAREPGLIEMWVQYSRRLRDMEQRENGYVTARSSVTGY